MTYHNAAKRILTAPRGSDLRSAERLSLLCQFLSLPLKKVPIVKIYGQSGKSACANFLSRALSNADYRTGVLSTPFANNITECITIDQKPISMEKFTHFVEATISAAVAIQEKLCHLRKQPEEESGEILSPLDNALSAYAKNDGDFSLFADEILLISALGAFFDSDCQIIILEIPSDERAGAYRLPTSPILSLITSTEDEDTARHICRTLDRSTPEIVSAMQSKSVYSMISDTCAQINCRLSMPLRSAYYPMSQTFNHMRFFYKNVEHSLNSGAHYQALNLLTVSEALDVLKRCGFHAKNDILNLSNSTTDLLKTTHFSFFSLQPTIVVDSADSPSRVSALACSLNQHKNLLGEKIVLIAEENSLSDTTLKKRFSDEGIVPNQILYLTGASAGKTLKSLAKELSADKSWIIIGNRHFIYEVTRTLQGLWAL